MAATIEDGKLRLSGDVGDMWFGDCFTSGDVVAALAQIDDGQSLDVHINSGGGIATEGAAIHALLVARSGTTNVVVEGIAASAASLIAMAGETVTMSAGAIMMIHDPSGFTMGTSKDHEKTIEGLEALATSYARVYAKKSGKTAAECRSVMKEETWLTPEKAVEMGFADATTEGDTEPVAAFDYRVYAHAPRNLVALAANKNWRRTGGSPAATAATTRPNQEQSMTEKNNGGANTAENEAALAAERQKAVMADRERRKAIMGLSEAKGREALAAYFADETEDDAEKVRKALAAAPKATAASTTDSAQADDETYEERRLNGAGLGNRDPKPKAKGDKAVFAAAVERTNKRR